MRRLLRLAARLYPAWWHRRYGNEFEALLDEVRPGWRELADIVRGALTMQIKTVATIPAVCALAGLIAGGIITVRTPQLFASTATIRVDTQDTATARSPTVEEFGASVYRALDASGGSREGVSIALRKSEATQSILKLTYVDRDPAQAQRVAETLTAAVATAASRRSASAEVLDGPGRPTSPLNRRSPATIASGGGAGLVAGLALLLLFRTRTRPPAAA